MSRLNRKRNFQTNFQKILYGTFLGGIHSSMNSYIGPLKYSVTMKL